MPCLKLLGRRWGVADDDVIFLATPWLFHVVWTVLLPILLQVPADVHPRIWERQETIS